MSDQPDYDHPLKWMAEHDPEGFLALIGQRVTMLRSLSNELTATPRLPDLVWEVLRPNGLPGILHTELQTKIEEDIGERLAEYAILLWKRYHLPVLSVVIFFRPKESIPASPFGWWWSETEETERYAFVVIKLWEIEPEVVLNTDHDILWPLAGVMGEATVDQLDEVAEHIIEAPLPRQRQGDLVSLLLGIAGLRFDKADVLEVLRRHPTMNDLWQESSFTDIVEEFRRPQWEAAGRVEMAREMAREALEGRFGTLSPDVLAAVNSADEATLKGIVAQIIAISLEEVRARLGLSAS